jgi:transcription-repair coupling factor (superfamily II helicase)
MDADRFGLSQLYQIRGRVGRGDKFAYAYLMYQPFKSLSESAVKRLNVIKEFDNRSNGDIACFGCRVPNLNCVFHNFSPLY